MITGEAVSDKNLLFALGSNAVVKEQTTKQQKEGEKKNEKDTFDLSGTCHGDGVRTGRAGDNLHS
jgi:hypothetical protein